MQRILDALRLCCMCMLCRRVFDSNLLYFDWYTIILLYQAAFLTQSLFTVELLASGVECRPHSSYYDVHLVCWCPDPLHDTPGVLSMHACLMDHSLRHVETIPASQQIVALRFDKPWNPVERQTRSPFLWISSKSHIRESPIYRLMNFTILPA